MALLLSSCSAPEENDDIAQCSGTSYANAQPLPIDQTIEATVPYLSDCIFKIEPSEGRIRHIELEFSEEVDLDLYLSYPNQTPEVTGYDYSQCPGNTLGPDPNEWYICSFTQYSGHMAENIYAYLEADSTYYLVVNHYSGFEDPNFTLTVHAQYQSDYNDDNTTTYRFTGDLDSAHDIIAHSDGSYYFSGVFNNRIRIGKVDDLTGQGYLLSDNLSGTESYRTFELYIDSQNRIYYPHDYGVARMDDLGDKQPEVIDLDGELIFIDSNDRLYIETSSNEIARYDSFDENSASQTSAQIDMLYVIQMAEAADGTVIVLADGYSDYPLLSLDEDMNVTADLRFQEGEGSQMLDRPSKMAIGPNGKIYILDAMNDRLTRVDDLNGNGWATFEQTANGFLMERMRAFTFGSDGSVTAMDYNGLVIHYADNPF